MFTSTAVDQPCAQARAPRIVCGVAQALVTLTAAFWIWFAASVAASEGVKSIGPALGIIAPLALIAALAWIRPAIGGTLAIAGGLVAAWIFPHPAPQLLMVLPLVSSGLALAWTGWKTPKKSQAA